MTGSNVKKASAWIGWALSWVLSIVMFGWWISSGAATYKPGVVIDCIQTEEEKERLKSLAIQAIDNAFQEQMQHLYLVWMRDSRDQPKRAQAGATNAISAWLGARKAMGSFQSSDCLGK